MRNVFENTKTLVAEIITLIIGFFWAQATNWDYEPLLLIILSGIGIITFIILRILPDESDKPQIDLEFIRRGAIRSHPTAISNISPTIQDNSGTYFEIVNGGIYYFTVERKYDLIIRNNSKHNAYKVEIYTAKNNYPIEFRTKQSSLEPILITQPRIIEVVYKVGRPMTHVEANRLRDVKFPDDVLDLRILVKYTSESKRVYYTLFLPPNNNRYFDKFRNIDDYQLL